MNFSLKVRGKFWNRLSIKEVHVRQYFYIFSIELKQCWMPVTNFLYCCPKGVGHYTKKHPLFDSYQKMQNNLVKLSYSSQKLLLRASVLILVLFFVLIIIYANFNVIYFRCWNCQSAPLLVNTLTEGQGKILPDMNLFTVYLKD